MYSANTIINADHNTQRHMILWTVVLGYLFRVVWARISLGQGSMFFLFDLNACHKESNIITRYYKT